MNSLRRWMDVASTKEVRELAELAGTTYGTLHQIAGGYRTKGAAKVRAGLARRIELAAQELRKRNSGLPDIVRTDLSLECRECEFAQKCLGGRAVASDFDPVS